MFLSGQSTIELLSDTFKENEAYEGSALYFIDTSSDSEFSLSRCTF